jgi:hypothetical protein
MATTKKGESEEKIKETAKILAAMGPNAKPALPTLVRLTNANIGWRARVAVKKAIRCIKKN